MDKLAEQAYDALETFIYAQILLESAGYIIVGPHGGDFYCCDIPDNIWKLVIEKLVMDGLCQAKWAYDERCEDDINISISATRPRDIARRNTKKKQGIQI